MSNRCWTVACVAVAILSAGAVAMEGGEDPIGPYTGHRLVRVQVNSPADMETMAGISDDPWARVNGGVEYRVEPGRMDELRASGLAYEVLVEDLQAVVDAERERLSHPDRDAGWFEEYKTFQQISDYVDTLVALRPDLARRIEIGRSREDRPIFGLRIANDNVGGPCKPGLLLFSCQHAREWISPMVNMYNADTLIRQYDTDPYIQALVDNAEIFIIPVVNPDGYEYTWDVYRFWRKNRRDNGDGTFGVDLNRNWGFGWGLDLPGRNGGSPITSSNTYWGTGPFSEPESSAVRDLFHDHPNIRAANDIHSYGQYILQPWSHSEDLPPEHATFDALGETMQQIILGVHGEWYEHGQSYTTLYPHCGTGTDWGWGGTGVYTFSFELRGPGFNPPPTTILPCAEETLPANLYLAEWIIDQFGFTADYTGDCAYDTRDVILFLNLWVTGDPSADFDGDGSITSSDFIAFLDAWTAGR